MLQRMAAGMQAERNLTLTTAGGLSSTARLPGSPNDSLPDLTPDDRSGVSYAYGQPRSPLAGGGAPSLKGAGSAAVASLRILSDSNAALERARSARLLREQSAGLTPGSSKQQSWFDVRSPGVVAPTASPKVLEKLAKSPRTPAASPASPEKAAEVRAQWKCGGNAVLAASRLASQARADGPRPAGASGVSGGLKSPTSNVVATPDALLAKLWPGGSGGSSGSIASAADTSRTRGTVGLSHSTSTTARDWLMGLESDMLHTDREAEKIVGSCAARPYGNIAYVRRSGDSAQAAEAAAAADAADAAPRSPTRRRRPRPDNDDPAPRSPRSPPRSPRSPPPSPPGLPVLSEAMGASMGDEAAVAPVWAGLWQEAAAASTVKQQVPSVQQMAAPSAKYVPSMPQAQPSVEARLQAGVALAAKHVPSTPQKQPTIEARLQAAGQAGPTPHGLLGRIKSKVGRAAHELVEGVEHLVEAEAEMDRAAQQEARAPPHRSSSSEGSSKGSSGTAEAAGRGGWGRLARRSAGDERRSSGDERRGAGEGGSSGDERRGSKEEPKEEPRTGSTRKSRRAGGRGAMAASLMKKRASKEEVD